MDSNTDYKNYKADRLLNDEYFLESEQHPTPESIAFWEKLSAQDEQLSQEIATARRLLHGIRNIPAPRLPQAEVDRMWKQINARNRREMEKSKRKRFFLYPALAAACILVFIVGGWYLRHTHQTLEEPGLPDIAAVGCPEAPTDDIRLILSEKKQITIQGKEGQLQYNQQGKINVNSRTIDLVAEEMEKKETYNQLIVPAGKRSSITFSDGTRLWLSANSRVVYPVKFTEQKREIYVEGEAFLDVHHDTEHPFIVKTDRMAIQVLGTTFNVCAYKQEDTHTVVLVTGSVEVKTNKNESQLLTPHNLLAYNEREGFSTKPVDVQEYIAWKDGFYLFHRENLETIAGKLGKYYGRTIRVDEALKDITCSGKLDLKDELDEVLRTLIQTVPAQLTKSNENIYIHVKPK